MKERVAVGMSGGVDSAVAAALLAEQGYEVIGVTARLWPDAAQHRDSDESIRYARETSDCLGIPHHVADLSGEFRRDVIDCFVAEYVRGRTPSPCPMCNRLIKFGLLASRASAWGASLFATGHYARIEPAPDGRMRLLSGTDSAKDQSYFLYGLDQEQLRRTLFPLGRMAKAEVRAFAKRRELPCAIRSESQDLCFAPDGDHAKIIERLAAPGSLQPGDMLDESGSIMGRHSGLHHYTIGQRRGLGIAQGRPVYVSRIDADANTVTVSPRAGLMSRRTRVEDVRWVSGRSPGASFPADTRVRYSHVPAPSIVSVSGDGSALVEFQEPQFAIAPGQAAVFYVNDEVIGGGIVSVE